MIPAWLPLAVLVAIVVLTGHITISDNVRRARARDAADMVRHLRGKS